MTHGAGEPPKSDPSNPVLVRSKIGPSVKKPSACEDAVSAEPKGYAPLWGIVVVVVLAVAVALLLPAIIYMATGDR